MTGVSGVVSGMAEQDYHSLPALSYSGAKQLLPPSCPAIYKWQRDNGRPDTAAFDFGHAAHKKVLGVGADIAVIDTDDWRTKAAQTARDEARAAGKVPLLAKDAATVDAMAEQLRAHPVAGLLYTGNGQPEVSAFWNDPDTGVDLRCRFDWLPEAVDGRLIVTDYKSAASAAPLAFRKSVADYLYHLQAVFYRDAAVTLGLAEDVEFLFCVQAKTPPYLVSVFGLTAEWWRIGEALKRQAVDLYAWCTARDYWPDFCRDEIAYLDPPAWYARTVEDLIA